MIKKILLGDIRQDFLDDVNTTMMLEGFPLSIRSFTSFHKLAQASSNDKSSIAVICDNMFDDIDLGAITAAQIYGYATSTAGNSALLTAGVPSLGICRTSKELLDKLAENDIKAERPAPRSQQTPRADTQASNASPATRPQTRPPAQNDGRAERAARDNGPARNNERGERRERPNEPQRIDAHNEHQRAEDGRRGNDSGDAAARGEHPAHNAQAAGSVDAQHGNDERRQRTAAPNDHAENANAHNVAHNAARANTDNDNRHDNESSVSDMNDRSYEPPRNEPSNDRPVNNAPVNNGSSDNGNAIPQFTPEMMQMMQMMMAQMGMTPPNANTAQNAPTGIASGTMADTSSNATTNGMAGGVNAAGNAPAANIDMYSQDGTYGHADSGGAMSGFIPASIPPDATDAMDSASAEDTADADSADPKRGRKKRDKSAGGQDARQEAQERR